MQDPRHSRLDLRRVGAPAALLILGFSLQAWFFARFPQPPVFGDAAGYYWAGRQVRESLAAILGGDGLGTALGYVRPILHFLGVGALFALLPSDRGHDLLIFRLLLAGINTLGMLGAFVLARRLSGIVGGIAALALGAVHPTFAMLAGRLYPEPVTACLLVWACVLYLQGVEEGRPRLLAGGGATLIAALLFRPKLIPYFLVLLAAASIGVWLRRREARRLVVAFAAGWLGLGLLWVAAALATRGPVDAKLPEYNLAWKQYYPYGFWQFLDSDGWEGPYRLKSEPYYKALEAAAQDDPDLLRSRSREYVFTIRYLASRPGDVVSHVLESLWRIYGRPENPYRWDYPIDESWQHALQVAIALCALAGCAVLIPGSPARAGLAFVPAAIAVLHALAFPLPRYAAPALPILLALAGGFMGWAWPQVSASRERAKAVGLALLAAAATGLAFEAAAGLLPPEAGRWIGVLGRAVLLGLPFLAALRLASHTRGVATAWAAVALLLVAHTLRDPGWHQHEIHMAGAVRGVGQDITLSSEALEALRGASESFIVFDLTVPRGDTRNLALEVNGVARPGSELVPTMPRLPEDTTLGGRDWRGYAQWWALPLTPDLLPARPDAPLRIRLRGQNSGATLRQDRFGDDQSVYEGPSFADWPHLVPVKLQYDGDCRIPARMPLRSLSTQSLVLRGDAWVPASGVHRIRIVTLAGNEGYASWESEPLPRAGRAALAFAALSGTRSRVADLLVGGDAAISGFPLGVLEDFDVAQGNWRLCFRSKGRRGEHPYGVYVLFGAPSSGAPVSLAVRFRTGMRDEPAYFALDRRRESEEMQAALDRCDPAKGTTLVDGVARLIDASHNKYPDDTGHWRVAEVY